jgi:hypothetical protein
MFPAFEKVKVLVGTGKNGRNVVGTWSERLAGERLAKGYMPAEAWILPIDNTELPNLSGTSCPRIIGLLKELEIAYADQAARNALEATAIANEFMYTYHNMSEWDTKARKSRKELFDFFDSIKNINMSTDGVTIALNCFDRSGKQAFRTNFDNRAKEYLMLRSGWFKGNNIMPSVKRDWPKFIGDKQVNNIRGLALKYASKISGKSDIEISALENPLSLLLD